MSRRAESGGFSKTFSGCPIRGSAFLENARVRGSGLQAPGLRRQEEGRGRDAEAAWGTRGNTKGRCPRVLCLLAGGPPPPSSGISLRALPPVLVCWWVSQGLPHLHHGAPVCPAPEGSAAGCARSAFQQLDTGRYVLSRVCFPANLARCLVLSPLKGQHCPV